MQIHRTVRRAALIAGLALATPAALTAQGVAVDEGVFRITIDGREAGTETFSIRQRGVGDGAVLVATGRMMLGNAAGPQEVAMSLEAARSPLRPVSYQLTVQGRDAQQIAGRLTGGRFTARIISPAGEMMREFLASDGAVLLDDRVAHHHAFLAGRATPSPTRIPVIVPRQHRQIQAEIQIEGDETLELNGRRIRATRVVIRPAEGELRRVWFDSAGRVLRFEVPGARYLAERTAPPS